MPCKRVTGDIFESQAEALVNPVNCIGISGKGLALEFKGRFLGNQAVYERACREGRVEIGRVITSVTEGWRNVIIFNVPTKRHWQDESTIEIVIAGVQALTGELRSRGIKSVAVPALGCGLGGLDAAHVFPIMEEIFRRECPAVQVELYEPLTATSTAPNIDNVAPPVPPENIVFREGQIITPPKRSRRG